MSDKERFEELDQAFAQAAHYKMSEDERAAQRRSFAYGNATLSNPAVTRAMVVEAELLLMRQERRRRALEGELVPASLITDGRGNRVTDVRSCSPEDWRWDPNLRRFMPQEPSLNTVEILLYHERFKLAGKMGVVARIKTVWAWYREDNSVFGAAENLRILFQV